MVRIGSNGSGSSINGIGGVDQIGNGPVVVFLRDCDFLHFDQSFICCAATKLESSLRITRAESRDLEI
jgi:hypothetical protein